MRGDERRSPGTARIAALAARRRPCVPAVPHAACCSPPPALGIERPAGHGRPRSQPPAATAADLRRARTVPTASAGSERSRDVRRRNAVRSRRRGDRCGCGIDLQRARFPVDSASAPATGAGASALWRGSAARASAGPTRPQRTVTNLVRARPSTARAVHYRWT